MIEIHLRPSTARAIAVRNLESARYTGHVHVENWEVLEQLVSLLPETGDQVCFVREEPEHRVTYTLDEMRMAVRQHIEVRPTSWSSQGEIVANHIPKPAKGILQALEQAGVRPVENTMGHDESLEVGIAAGLDVPTAMVLSTEKSTAKHQVEGCLVLIAVVLCVIWEILKLF